jgi:DNA-binding IclR family transcriptional regulator
MRPVTHTRSPVSPDLTATQLAVLHALICATEPVGATELADTAGLTVAKTRRALGDLRELHVASMTYHKGRNVWTAL